MSNKELIAEAESRANLMQIDSREDMRAAGRLIVHLTAALAAVSDTTPSGLTVSDDESLLNWQGVNYELQAVGNELADAIRLTVEYVGNDTLPAAEGWSWFDALMNHRPGLAQPFIDNPVLPGSAPTPSEGERKVCYQCSGCAGISGGHDPVIHAKTGLTPPAPVDREHVIAVLNAIPGHVWDAANEIGDLSVIADGLIAAFPALAVSPAPAPSESENARVARGIRAFTRTVRSELDATREACIDLGQDYLHGVYSALQQADDHAARIENDLYDDTPAPARDEWEYNTRAGNGFLYEVESREGAEASAEMSKRVHDYPGSSTMHLIREVVRRHPAGPWLPVTEEERA